MRKRGIALFVAALMIGALAFPAGANVNPFTDLRSDHWAYEAIVKLAAAGLIEGYPDGTFGGDRTFTRYEMAMVFARILARFENLIDQKIHEGIDAKTAQLAYEIEAVRKELSDRIDANYDELVRDTSDIRARLGLPPFDRSNRSGAGLTGDARAALAGQVSDEMLDQLRILLKEDLDDLARRVRDVERALLDERDVERIAHEVIANALGGDVEDLEAAEGNPAGAAILLAKRVDELESTMADMALEFGVSSPSSA